MLERLIEHINGHDGIRWATFDEIADDFAQRSPRDPPGDRCAGEVGRCEGRRRLAAPCGGGFAGVKRGWLKGGRIGLRELVV